MNLAKLAAALRMAADALEEQPERRKPVRKIEIPEGTPDELTAKRAEIALRRLGMLKESYAASGDRKVT